MTEQKDSDGITGMEIAVIGMAGRFPGANNIDEFWENLKNGVESISFFTDEELEKAGVATDFLENPNYVKAGGVVENKMRFDSFFFGYSPREAELMAPQMRVLHQCIWSALEDAAYVPGTYPGRIGLFCGASSSTHWEILSILSGKRDMLGEFAALTFADKDQSNMRVSYNLNLRGPSVIIQTACSTALVGIHLASQGLVSGDCDMALAGGVTIPSTDKTGYLYQEGGIYSPDGHCRPFDQNAGGTLSGEGAGIVVLKPLEDALTDDDNIYAVIKGSAINNDGRAKVGYSAPGAPGQAAVIHDAYQAAEVDPASVTYIETHGTGTAIGDPIEIEALKSVFAVGNKNKKSCRIGSVKSNIGHVIDAAGAAGFIKTALALKHRFIPPTLHFETPNPKIDFENSPFIVNTRLTQWEGNGTPLRAGVSSFGIGGTNAHIILEEAPPRQPSPGNRPYPHLLFSAKTMSALDRMADNFREYLTKNPGLSLADAAYTLQVGRETFNYRRTVACHSVEEAVDAMESENPRKIKTFFNNGEIGPLVFMFPGLGAQYVNMGWDLYRNEPLFREKMDRCFGILKSLSGYNAEEILYPGHTIPQGRDMSEINRFEISQAVIFIFEYALAELLMEWGIEPNAMIGYSFGEYAAACLAGVFSLEDALKLVTLRGRLMEKTQPGRMLSVPLGKEELEPLLDDGLSIAIDNGSSCIAAGEINRVKALEDRLQEKKHLCFPLQTRHAVHSVLMEPILEEFETELRKVCFHKPRIPYISNLTGDWITDAQALDPAYWSKHLRCTVRFGEGVKKLLQEPGTIFLEVGPGRDLNALIQRYLKEDAGGQAVNLVRVPEQEIPDNDYLWNKIGQLWLHGRDIHWEKIYGGKTPRRISLPAYPFEGETFSMETDIAALVKEKLPKDYLEKKKTDLGDWMYVPVWEQSFAAHAFAGTPGVKRNRLVFIDEMGVGTRLLERLRQNPGDMIVVRAGERFREVSEGEFILNPAVEQDYETLLAKLKQLKKLPGKILHLWNITGNTRGIEPGNLDMSQYLGFYSLLNIARAIGKLNILDSIEIEVITDNMHRITCEETFLCPGKATLLGAVKIVPLEYPNIKCRGIDIVVPGQEDGWDTLIRNLEKEFEREIDDIIIAYRGAFRWKKSVKPIRMEKSREENRRLRKNGVYLITGGLGAMGLTFARYLSRAVQAKLVLVGRTTLPPRENWQERLSSQPADHDICRRIRKLQEIEKNGSEVMVCSADVSHPGQMEKVITRAEERFGPFNGILHAAGVIDFAGVIYRRTREDTEKALAAKVKGTLVLEYIFKNRKANLDFFVLFSSAITTFYFGSYGQVGYIAANEFLNAFTHYKKLQSGPFIMTINWADWKEVGMTVNAFMHRRAKEGAEFGSQELIRESMKEIKGMMPEEGVESFCRVLNSSLPEVIISPYDAIGLLESIKKSGSGADAPGDKISSKQEKRTYIRQQVTSDYIPPRNELERKITGVWEDIFGFEDIGIHDDFFEMGGDSVLASVFANNFKELLREIVHVTVIFDAPTIARLAAYFEKNYPAGAARLGGGETVTGTIAGDNRESVDNTAIDAHKEDGNLEEILEQIDSFPDDKVDGLLNEMMQGKNEKESINE